MYAMKNSIFSLIPSEDSTKTIARNRILRIHQELQTKQDSFRTYSHDRTGALGQRDMSLAVLFCTESLLRLPISADVASECPAKETMPEPRKELIPDLKHMTTGVFLVHRQRSGGLLHA